MTINEFQEQIESDLSRIKFPQVYKDMVYYIFDILAYDGSEYGYKLKTFRALKSKRCICVTFTLIIDSKPKQFYLCITPNDLTTYSLSLTNNKYNKSWKLNNIETSNYINSIGLLLYPTRLTNFENVQYSSILKTI